MSKRTLNLQRWTAFVICYVALDWVGDLHAFHGLDITPWNPSVPLGMICWLRYGRLTALPWFVALILGDLVIRGLPMPLANTIVVSGMMVAGYGLIAEGLRRHMKAGMLSTDQWNLVSWLAKVIIGTLATSCLYIALLYFFGVVSSQDWGVAALRFWIGDGVGIIVLMPFFGILFEAPQALCVALLRRETAAYVTLAVSILWFITEQTTGKATNSYLLFIPIVWAAARQGLVGASFAALVIQVGVIFAAQKWNLDDLAVFRFQIRGAVLSFVGFFIGVIIDEKQRVNLELQRTLRLATAGEMAGALAHELNQPLSALVAYGDAVQQLLEHGETGNRLHDAVERMVAESFRASEVVQRLRNIFSTGTTKLEHVRLSELISSVAALFKAQAQQKDIELIMDPVPACMLQVDRLQMEVVLRNLLANAFDAVDEQPPGKRRVRLSAQRDDDAHLCVCVEDSGTGISDQMAERLFEAFASSKSSGLGLGLAICRAIVEAHGGRIWAEKSDHGLFKLVLPTESVLNHAN